MTDRPWLARPTAIPNSTGDLLVLKHTYTYNGNRRQEVGQIDPYGRVSLVTYDHAGRRMQVLENHSATGGQPTRWAKFQYTPDGLINKITASNVVTGPQTTEYVYGGTMDGVRPSILLAGVKDPEGRITSFTYNRQQEVVTMIDANKTVHRYRYDKLGRLLTDSILWGWQVDQGTRQIAYE